jgi:OMF family outer membrane factor
MSHHLSYNHALLKEKYAYENLQKVKYSFLPTLSFVGSNSYNVYNQDFKVFGGDWINNNYVGLKLNWVLPNASLITNRTNAKYQHLLAQKTSEQTYTQAQNDVAQLENEVRKAISQYSAQREILAIQTDTYQKNENLYREGLQSLDKLLISFNNKVNAEYQTISSKVAVDLAYSKIDNHNKFSTYAK